MALDLADDVAAKAYYEQALALARQLGARQVEVNALGNLGNVPYALADYTTAKAYYGQALALARQLGDRQGEANALGSLELWRSEQRGPYWGQSIR